MNKKLKGVKPCKHRTRGQWNSKSKINRRRSKDYVKRKEKK
jgi:hypothetical protein